MNNSGKTLFIVNSPFQCLCMLEAIEYFNIKEFTVFQSADFENSTEYMERLLTPLGISIEKMDYNHIVKSIPKHLFSKHDYYDTIFIGNFMSYDFILAWIYGKIGANVCYLDDGVQTVYVCAKGFRRTYKNWKIKIVISFYSIFAFFKGMMKKNFFFTIYDVQTDKFRIIRNPFCRLRDSIDKIQKGVYIIGTNSELLPIKNHSYEEYLYKLISRLKETFPNEIIYYCPHRRDKNTPYVLDFCRKQGIEIFDTKISVEADFISLGIRPRYIAGFGSNALITLRMLYPDIVIENFLLDFDSDKLTAIYNQTACYFSNYCIETIKLYK